MSKSCSVCSKDPSPYKCPKCSFPYCSVACCKVHKESCQQSDTKANETGQCKEDTILISDGPFTTATTTSTSTAATSSSSSQRVKDFLEANPYLQSQLPVLLARIDRNDPTATAATAGNPASQLAKDLEKRERVTEVLKEAIETDPKVAELYKLLQEENIL